MTDTSTTQLELSTKTVANFRPAADQPSTTSDGLLFRVHGSSHHGRLVRVSRRACSVGSDLNCGLRLVGSGIAPMHCLILRGRRGTAVRCWSKETQLNGADFVDEWLKPGDRLTIGSIDLEFVSESKSFRAIDSAVGVDAPTFTSRSKSVSSTPDHLDARRLNKKRVKRLCQSLRMANKQIDILQTEIHQHHEQVERLLAKVVHLEQYLSGETENQTKVDEFEVTVRNLEQECATWRDESQRQRGSWRRNVQELAKLVDADLDLDGDIEEDALMQRLQEHLTQRLSTLEAAQERDRHRFEEQLARQREQLDTQLQQLNEGQEILIERESELEQARDDLKRSWNDLDRAKNEQPDAGASQAELDELRANLADVESQRNELQSEVEVLRGDCERLASERQRDVDEPTEEQSREQEELARQLAQERAELEEQHRQLQSETEEQLDDLRQREAELAERIEEFDRQAVETQPLSAADSQTSDLTDRYEELTQQIESALAAQEQAESALTEQRRQYAETQDQLDNARTREAELCERIENLDRRLEESHEKLKFAPAPDEVSARLEGLTQQLESARTAQREAETALEELRQEVAENEAVQESTGELDEAVDEDLQQQREQLAHDQEQLRLDQDFVRDRQDRLDEAFREVTEERKELEQEREEWAKVRGQIEEKIEEHIDNLGAPVFSSIDQDFVGSSEPREDEPREDYQEPEEIEYSTPDDSSPADTSDLRKLLPEDNDPPESDTSQPESIGLFQAGAGENEQDDQMISDYMQRLLSRDGSSEPSSAAAYQSSSTETESPQTFGSHYKPVDGYGQDKTADQAAKEDKNKEYAPRVRAPELDLSVMRDIANESARSAINRYSFKVWLHAAVVRWSVSIVAFITGVILLYWAQDFSTIAGFSGLAALVVSLFWLLQGLWLTRFAWRSRIRYHKKAAVAKSKAKQPVEESVAPAEQEQQEGEDQ